MVHLPWGYLDGFAGICNGKLFGTTPSWVDTKKAPGHTSQAQLLSLRSTAQNFFTLPHFFFTPNFVWFAMVLTVYVLVPYDIAAAAKGFSLDWMGKRLAVNFAVALSYYGFFFYGLYVANWSQRKFQPGVFPTVGNMMHNLWYWSLGILQWTFHECLMVRLWATDKVPYVSDDALFNSLGHVAATAVWILVIPLWRDLHFYFAHRFSHIRAFYKYVHSLHHRNADPEPFSGLCMHPVEHLVYFSNALTPSLYVSVSPIIYLWNFMHLSIAPGAGHSGWEDHFQADQYHYLHHAKFECNYGSPTSGFIDQYLGTFREKLGASTGEVKTEDAGPKVWSAQGYLGLQTIDHFSYTLFCLATTWLFVWAAVWNPKSAVPVRFIAGLRTEVFVATLVTYGPVAFALLLWSMFDQMSWRWPFHRQVSRIVWLLRHGGMGLVSASHVSVCIGKLRSPRWAVYPNASPSLMSTLGLQHSQ